MDANKSWSSGFEFVDIEIIDHKNETEKEKPVEKFKCDQCSLFFLNKEKLILHQKKHVTESEDSVKCRYCNKILSITEESKESYSNRKCETCEYRCTICPQRFLRHSSLLNHEKNHKLPRKKQTSLINRKRINGLKTPYNIENRVSKRGRPRKYPLIASNTTNKEKENSELGISPKKKQKIQSESSGSDDSTVNLDNEVSPNTKTLKRSSVRAGKSSAEVMSSPTKNKTNTAVSNSPLSTQISENGVNYKPFSCHVCGDHFVSDSVLLEHIKTHGDVTKGFKCKHCDDEFVDIYKMQFHLAICPFAEDELETSIKKNSLPPQFLAKQSVTVNEIPRKRGRPRKIKTDMPQNSEEVHKPVTTTAKRYSIKRKSDDPAGSVIKTPRGVRTSLPVRFRKNSRSKSLVTDTSSGINEQGESHSDDNVDDDSEDVMVDDDINTSTKNDHLDSGDEERKKMHACPFPRCDFKFTREKALLCHMRNHNDDFDEVLKCHKCDIPFDDLRSLRIHIDDCKGIKEEKDDDFEEPDDPDIDDQSEGVFHTFQRSKGSFLCKVCGRAYNTAAKLKRCIHPSQENCDLTCRLCRVKFEDEKTLKKHFRRCHPGRFPYQCPKCPVEFDTISVRASHVATHVDSDQDFQCFVCSIKLPTYKELYFHYSHVHVGKLDMICKYCNKIFPTRTALQEHIRVHKLGSRFTCIFCPKSFFSSQSLTVHMKRHTNKRLYKCKVCHRAFLDSSAVFQHMLFHASALVAEQPFKCCICFLGFTQKSGLKTHIGNNHSEHTTCPVCEETAEDVPEMILHILNHSIKISKNSMSKAETIWMKKSGVKKETDQESPLPKLRGQKRMSLDDNKLDGRDGKEIKLEPAEELSKYNTRRSRLVIKQEDDEDIDLGNAQKEDYSKSKQKQSRLRKPSTKYSSSTGIDTPKKPTRKSLAVFKLTNRTSNSVKRRKTISNHVKEFSNSHAHSGNDCSHSFGMVTNKKSLPDEKSVPKSRVNMSTTKIISQNKPHKSEPGQLLRTKTSKDNLIIPNLFSLDSLSKPSVKRSTISPRNRHFSIRARRIKSRMNQHNLTVEEAENNEGDYNYRKKTFSKDEVEKISTKTELVLKGKFSNKNPLRRSSRVVINKHNLLDDEEIKPSSNNSYNHQKNERQLIKKNTTMNSVAGTYGISVKSSDSVSENGDLPKKERPMSFICVTNNVKPLNKLVKSSTEKNSLSGTEIYSDIENVSKSNNRDLMLSEKIKENLTGQDLNKVQRSTKSVEENPTKEKVINVESNYKRLNAKTETVKNKTRHTSEISCSSLSKSFERSLTEAAVKSSHNVFENMVCEAKFDSFKDFEQDKFCTSSPVKSLSEDLERVASSVNSFTDNNENSASDNEIKTDSESSTSYIKEAKYFGPSLNPATYSCTTCMLDFSSHEALLQHTTFHIF